MVSIKKVDYNPRNIAGCPTCDYGSNYIDNIKITLENDEIITIKFENMYEHALSEEEYMKLLANSDNANQFIRNAIKEIKDNNRYDNLEYLADHGLKITKNGKEIDIIKTDEKGAITYKKGR